MSLKPVYQHLSNSLITDKGLEYSAQSKKAISIVRLVNEREGKTDTYGFLFTNVRLISQKVKSNKSMTELGCDDLGMLHFLYSTTPDDDNYTLFMMNADDNYILIEAESVELIDGLMFM